MYPFTSGYDVLSHKSLGGKSFNEFFEMNKKFGILRLLRIGYEPFHLTGEEGIALEVESHIRKCGGKI